MRYIAITQWRSVLLVGILLIVSGGGIAIISGVPMEDVTDPSSTGTMTVEQRHHAQAVSNASVYQPGQHLRGKALYLISDTPNVNVQEIIRTSGGPPAAVTAKSRVEYQVRHSNSIVFNEKGRSSQEEGTITQGNLTVEMELDMVQVRDRLQALRERFGGETSVQATIVTEVNVDPSSAGALVSRTPIEFTSNGYHIPTVTKTKEYGSFEVERVPASERTVTFGGIVVGKIQLYGGLVGIVGLCLVVASLRYLRHVPIAARKSLYQTVIHRRFSELIARVESGECPAVDREMESLEDLVFVGSDGEEPILFFPQANRYIVHSNDIVYGFQFEV